MTNQSMNGLPAATPGASNAAAPTIDGQALTELFLSDALLTLCDPGDKCPTFAGWLQRGAGTFEDFKALREEFPRLTMLGALSGGPSDLVAVDVDWRNGGKEGLADAETRYGSLGEPRCDSPGGVRYVFSFPRGLRIKCRNSDIAPGVDVKGGTDTECKGQVVMPPSVRTYGGEYRWRPGYSSLCGRPPVPRVWLFPMLFNKRQRERLAVLGITGPDCKQLAGADPTEWEAIAREALRAAKPKRTVSGEATPERLKSVEHYVRKSIGNVVAEMRATAEGARDEALNTAVITIWGLIKGAVEEGLNTTDVEEWARDTLEEAALHTGLPQEVFEEKWERVCHDADPRDLSDVGHRAEQRRVLKAGDPMPSAAALIEEKFTLGGIQTLHYVGGDFLRWGETHYETVSDAAIDAEGWKFLERADRVDDKGERHRFAPTTNKVRDVVNALRARCVIDPEPKLPAWLPGAGGDGPAPNELLSCSNGLLHIASRRLLPLTPAFLSVNALPYAYVPDAREPEHWHDFLRSLWTDDAGKLDTETIETLQEWFGYFLTLDTGFQKILFLHGEKRTGKGTVCRVLRALVGEDNCTGPTLASLSGDFGFQPLIGKQLALISDARLGGKTNKPALLERLLSVSGEDAVSVNRKNRTAWEGRLTTRFVIVSNDVPDIPDSSGAFASRCIVLHFARSFYGREDRGLEAKLLSELPGILNWSLAGLERLLQRGHFRQPAAAAQIVDELYDLANPVAAFVRECCEVGPDKRVERDILFWRWQAWCRETGQHSFMDRSRFGAKLRAAVPSLEDAWSREGGDPKRCYRGVGLPSAAVVEGWPPSS